MATVEVNGNLEDALAAFKRMNEDAHTLREYRRHTAFISDGEQRRFEKKAQAKRQRRRQRQRECR